MKIYMPIINPKLLDILSAFSPITIGNITPAPFVISRREMSKGTERHEVIHVYQQYECAALGALITAPLFLWIGWWALPLFLLGVFSFYPVYLLSWVYWVIRLQGEKDPGKKAYYLIAFEREAYNNQGNASYLKEKKWFAWFRQPNFV